MNNTSGFEFAFDAAPLPTQKSNRKQPVQSRSQATCAAILEATIQVLVQQGFERLTTTRVAERAGVSVGSLYQYYPNKAALTEAVRAEYFRQMSLSVQSVMRNAADLTPEEKLDQALAAVIAVKRKYNALSLALAKMPPEQDGGDFSSEIVCHFSEFVLKILETGGPASEDQHARARLLIASVEGALSFAVKNEPQWLAEPWFVASLQNITRTGLADMQDRDKPIDLK